MCAEGDPFIFKVVKVIWTGCKNDISRLGVWRRSRGRVWLVKDVLENVDVEGRGIARGNGTSSLGTKETKKSFEGGGRTRHARRLAAGDWKI